MKKVHYISLCIIFIISAGLVFLINEIEGDELEDNSIRTSSKRGTIIKSKIPQGQSSSQRTVVIYLPVNYDKDTINYPVFYFLDGQLVFDEKILNGEEWQVDEVLDSLAKFNKKAIAVGIYNSKKRNSEYLPNLDVANQNKNHTGSLHAQWIVKTVKPWVDSNYRTKPDPSSTIIGGTSCVG